MEVTALAALCCSSPLAPPLFSSAPSVTSRFFTPSASSASASASITRCVAIKCKIHKSATSLSPTPPRFSSAPTGSSRFSTPSASSASSSIPRCLTIRCTLGSRRTLSSSSSSWGCIAHLLPPLSKGSGSVVRRAQAENTFVDVELEEGESHTSWGPGPEEEEEGAEHFGEVDLILASRVEDRKTEYLILWKDDSNDSWEPAENIASDVVAEYEKPWWQAARKADVEQMKELLDNEELQRDVNAIDENERTALLFAAGVGSEKCVRFLCEYGADVHWQDKDGFTALHIASGYVHVNTVKALVELGADPDLEDGKGRSALSLAEELLKRTPRANPLQFARRMALDQVVKALDEVMYETVEVEQVLDKRIGEGGVTEYLVKWNDDSENGWVPATDIGEDLVKDYEDGLEYGIVEKVLDRREADGKVQYFVKWSDGAETWETEENVGEEVAAEYNSSQIPQ